MIKSVLLAAVAVAALASPASALTFILNDTGGVGMGTQARAGFQAAADLWSAAFTDNATIVLDVGFRALGPNILGSTGSTANQINYAGLQQVLALDRTSFRDNRAVNHLQAGSLSYISNEPGNCVTNVPTCMAIDSRVRVIDNDNTVDNNNIRINTANVKALGLNPVYAANNPGGRDGSVTFSTLFNFDFDRSDGITPGLFDFVGVAAHEIGHALGFVSGVDLVDGNAEPFIPPPGRAGLDGIAYGTTLDLFRYDYFDPANPSGDRLLSWAVGGTPCLSLDAGASCLGTFSTGSFNGDRRQASHWKDDQLTGIYQGIMDPSATGPNNTRPFARITPLDLTAFDVIGYDLRVAVPEPATMAIFGLGAAALGLARRRRG